MFFTCFERIVRVAGAIFTETGVHSLLSLSLTAASSESLITSIPEKYVQGKNICHFIKNHNYDQDTKHNKVYFRCFLTDWFGHSLTAKVVNVEALEELVLRSRKLCERKEEELNDLYVNYQEIQGVKRPKVLPSIGMTTGLLGSEFSLLTPGLVAFLSIII